MKKPMIESNDRGITLNKSLAWTILATLMTGAFYFGTQDARQSTDIANLDRLATENRQDIRENRQARAAQAAQIARIEQRLVAIQRSAEVTESSMQQLERYLREIAERPDE